MCHNTHPLSFYRVILNKVKNLNKLLILCVAKDDQMTEKFHFDTLISYDLYDIPF